jgi:hypothetical protein
VNVESNQHDVLMTIQNNKRPDQLIFVVRDHDTGGFRTEGLKNLFGVKEIRVDFQELMQAVPEYGEVLSFLLETMSAAKELNLPYAYEDEFNYRNMRFTLHADGDYRVLHRVE